MIRFLLCAALCGLASAQTPTSRPESAPTSRPWGVASKEFLAVDAEVRSRTVAADNRLKRCHEIVKEIREAWGDTTKQRLRDELNRIQEEHGRAMVGYEELAARQNRLAEELDAWGIEDVRAWYRTHGTEIPGLPDWRYADGGAVDVVFEQLGDWVGIRLAVGFFVYVGPWERRPAAVRIDWRIDDAFGDPLPGVSSTTTKDLPPDDARPIYIIRLAFGPKVGQASAEHAQPDRGAVRLVGVRGKSVPAK